RLALSRAPAPGQEGLGDRDVGADRRQPAREVLSAHTRRQATAPARGIAVDRTGHGDRPNHEAGRRAWKSRGLTMSISSWWTRQRRLDEDDFQDEIRAHLAIAADERVADGADRRAAQLASLKEFGNVTLTTEAARRVWLPAWLEAVHDIFSDIRYS